MLNINTLVRSFGAIFLLSILFFTTACTKKTTETHTDIAKEAANAVFNKVYSGNPLTTNIANQGSCTGTNNPFDVYAESPVLVKSVPNGKLYVVGPDQNKISIVHLYGTPEQKGAAYGSLFADVMPEALKLVNDYIDHMIADEIIKKVPISKALALKLASEARVAAMDLEIAATDKHTPQYFKDYVAGVAKTSGISYKDIMGIQMIPEAVRAACSMIGAWGSSSSTGSVVQLRALDFDPNLPSSHYPLITVDHASNNKENTFMSLGWVGFLGTVTGASTENAVTEKYWRSGKTTRFGIPFNILLSDILRNDKTIEDSFNRLKSAARTCSIYIGVSSKSDGEFRAHEYSAPSVTQLNWNTPFSDQPASPAHPAIQNVVYINKHIVQSTDSCLGDQIQSYLDKNKGLSPRNLLDMAGMHQTGDSHIMITDFANNAAYVAVADQNLVWSPDKTITRTPAYQRQAIKIDLAKLYGETE